VVATLLRLGVLQLGNAKGADAFLVDILNDE
jgi:hypothetical protein